MTHPDSSNARPGPSSTAGTPVGGSMPPTRAALEVELELMVARCTQATEDVAVLELQRPDEGELPAWSPGAHVELMLDEGLVRQYSLCGDHTDRSSWRLGVLLDPHSRGGSAFVHASLRVPGRRVRVRGPRNHFELVAAPRYLFVAGGIGITPLLPMIRAATARGAAWELHYGGRRRGSMAFLDDVAALAGGTAHLHPQDEVGPIDLRRILGPARTDMLIYACGPESLLNAVEAESATWPPTSLHVERFRPREVEGADDRQFEVELRSSGLTLTVAPDRTLLSVLEEAGVPVMASCEEGTCGTCETRVLAGRVDHRDSLLSPTEQDAHDVMFVCVSRAEGGRLVLDL